MPAFGANKHNCQIKPPEIHAKYQQHFDHLVPHYKLKHSEN